MPTLTERIETATAQLEANVVNLSTGVAAAAASATSAATSATAAADSATAAENAAATAEGRGRFIVAEPTQAAVLAAYASAVAAGGGTIVLPSARITLTAPLPITHNIIYEGVPIKMVMNDGVDGPANNAPTVDGEGTVLVGDGTFNGIEGHSSDNSSIYGTPSEHAQDAIRGCGIQDVCFTNFLNGVHIGGRNHMGAIYSRFRGIYVFDCTGWGVVFKNYIHNSFEDILTFSNYTGGQLFEFDIPTELNGNSVYKNLMNTAPYNGANGKINRLARGIVFRAHNTLGMNFNTVNSLQSNRFGNEPIGGGSKPVGTGVTVNTTAGSSNITVSDAAEFLLDMPVSFKAAGIDPSFTANKVYFVTYKSGTTIRLSDRQRSTPIYATNTGTPTLISGGFPCLEIVAPYISDTIAAQTPVSNAVTFSGTGLNPDFCPGAKVQISTTGTMPGLSAATDYWLIPAGGSAYKFASTRENAAAGIAITLSSAWTGTATVLGTSFVAAMDFLGVDLEGGGTCAAYFQNCEEINFSCDATQNGGATASQANFLHNFVARSVVASAFRSEKSYSTDFVDGANRFAGVRNITDSVGVIGIGTWLTTLNGVGTLETNLDPSLTLSSNYSANLTQRLAALTAGGVPQAIKFGRMVLENVNKADSSSVFYDGAGGTLVYVAGGNGAWTLPTIANTDTNHTRLGSRYTVVNCTANKIVLTPGASQKFNDKWTTYTIGAYQSATFVAADMSGSGAFTWALNEMRPEYLATGYSATTNVDLGRSVMQSIEVLSADLTITLSNIPKPGTEVIIGLQVDGFPSGTRNVTWPSSCKFPTAFTQPVAGTGYARTQVVFRVNPASQLIAVGGNAWY